MKKLLWFAFAFYGVTNSYSQSANISDNKSFQITLIGDPPMPRENQEYNVGMDLSDLRKIIFQTFKKSDSSAIAKPYYDRELIRIFSIDQLKKGKNIVGPLNFSYGGFNFVTSTLTYQVDDSLPNTNQGLWIRHSLINDSSFCLSIDQRIPIEYDGKDDLTVIINNNHVCQDMVMLNFAQSKFNAFDYTLSENGCSMANTIINGEKKYYFYKYDNTCVAIKPHTEEIQISKDDFLNIPEYFNFSPIIIK